MSNGLSMPSGLANGGSPIRETGEASPRVQAYWARHEPLASEWQADQAAMLMSAQLGQLLTCPSCLASFHRSINGREDIDRLLAGEA